MTSQPRTISVRTDRQAKRVADTVVACGPIHEFSQSVTILIHGFQNSVERASESYQRFRRGFANAASPSSRPAVERIWYYHWPGDLDQKIISTASFPTRIPDAERSGERLARFLLDHVSPESRISLVAHSLGCLVALETVRMVEASHPGSAVIDHVVLLAAAVPEVQCMPGDSEAIFYPSRERREVAIFSHNDRALGVVYKLGLQQYTGKQFDAVGKYGGPPRRWNATFHSGLGHGDYWPSRWIAQQVAVEFGVAQRRFLDTWTEVSVVLPSVEVAERALSVRALPVVP